MRTWQFLTVFLFMDHPTTYTWRERLTLTALHLLYVVLFWLYCRRWAQQIWQWVYTITLPKLNEELFLMLQHGALEDPKPGSEDEACSAF